MEVISPKYIFSSTVSYTHLDVYKRQVQDVYQELIADLRADKLAMKKDKEESETRWTTRIEKLENNQQSQDKKIADNEKEIADLKRFKCINLSCNNRKQ